MNTFLVKSSAINPFTIETAVQCVIESLPVEAILVIATLIVAVRIELRPCVPVQTFFIKTSVVKFRFFQGTLVKTMPSVTDL